MVRCFVTGGTGFIGSHIVKNLVKANHEIDVLIRKSSNLSLLEDLPINTRIGDVTDQESLMREVSDDIEWLFHNAAIMADWGGKDHFFPVNVKGTRNVLEVVRSKDIPFLIHTSSTALYGFPNLDKPLNEDSPRDPINWYQESKVAAENLLSEYENDYGLRITRVRPPTVVGSGDMFTGPQILGFLNEGRMVLFGDGSNIHSFAHAEDVARCLILAAKNPTKSIGEAFNVISFACTFKEFIDAIVSELGVTIKYRRIRYGVALGIGRLLSGVYSGLRRPNSPLLTPFRVKLFGSKYLIDISKAREELGYEPNWNLESTAKDIVDWGGEVKPR